LTAGQTAAAKRLYASALAADAFTRSLLHAHGVPAEDAATIAACLVRAELRGVDTHGLCWLPIYLERVRKGLINPRPALEVKRVTPVAASLDGQNGFGFVVGCARWPKRSQWRGSSASAWCRRGARRITAWPRATRCRRSRRV
jgi:hypothetical protein